MNYASSGSIVIAPVLRVSYDYSKTEQEEYVEFFNITTGKSALPPENTPLEMVNSSTLEWHDYPAELLAISSSNISRTRGPCDEKHSLPFSKYLVTFRARKPSDSTGNSRACPRLSRRTDIDADMLAQVRDSARRRRARLGWPLRRCLGQELRHAKLRAGHFLRLASTPAT